MRRSTTRAGRAFAAAAIVAAVAAAAPVTANEAPHDTTGRWTGFYGTHDTRGYGTPDTRGSFTMEILAQEGRRFTGLVRGVGDPEPQQPIPIEGTISESGQVSLQGRSIDGAHLVVHGRATELDERGLLVPCVLEARFSLRGPAGAIEGRLVALHQPEEASLTPVEGPYEGTVHPVGGVPATLTATFQPSTAGGQTAEVDVEDPNFSDNPDFRGAVALVESFDPETKEFRTSFALVGGGPAGLLVMRGLVGPDYRIQGDLHVTGNDGSTLTEGTFEIEPFVPTTHG